MLADRGPSEPDLLVYLGDDFIAEISRTGAKGGGRLRYLRDDVDPLSTAMPSGVLRHKWKVLGPWIEGLLPERQELLRQWRREAEIKDESPLSLLECVGEEVAGAARFIRPGRLEEALSPGELLPQSQAEIAADLRLSRAAQPPALGNFGLGKFSLAGTQAKIARHRDEAGNWFLPTGQIPTTHIIKPVIANYPGQELAEHMMISAADAVGLIVARSEVVTFEDIPTIVVERYDRVWTNGALRRVHQEDFTQALGVAPAFKYQQQGGPGPQQIADHIRAHVTSISVQDDVERFVQALIFNWLTVGTDAHAKNYSLLLDGSHVRLAPIYDLNSVLALGGNSAASMSMRIGSQWHADAVRWTDWLDLATLLGVDENWLRVQIFEQIEVIPGGLFESMVRLQSDGVDVAGAPSRLVEGVARWTIVAGGNISKR